MIKARGPSPSIILALLTAAILITLGVAAFHSFRLRRMQYGALANAKTVGLALKLYAGDHDGVYPSGVNAYGERIETSNDAFRSLFSAYIRSETVFGCVHPADQIRPPDNVISPPSKILQPGENILSYVMGLSDASNPSTPLVANISDNDDKGVYTRQALENSSALDSSVIIRADNSAGLEHSAGPQGARRAIDFGSRNLLSLEALPKGAELIHPAKALNRLPEH